MKEGTQQKKEGRDRERENNRVPGDSWLVFLENLSFREAFSTFILSSTCPAFTQTLLLILSLISFFPGSLVSSSGWRGVRDPRRRAEGEDRDQSPAAPSIGLREKKGERERARESERGMEMRSRRGASRGGGRGGGGGRKEQKNDGITEKQDEESKREGRSG